MLRAQLAKEWRLLLTPGFGLALSFCWLALGWYLLAGLEEYNAIAGQLAQLENRRGATEMYLGAANQWLQTLMVLWSIYFGARSLAQERQWQTQTLHYGSDWTPFLWAKALVLGTCLLLLTLPFWLVVLWLQSGVHWDGPLLAAQALGQLFFLLFALGLSLSISATQSQALSASLLTALAWLLLWLAPTLSTSPAWLPLLLRYLSPFEHFQLLQQGIVALQTGAYLLFMLFIFGLATAYCWPDR